MRAKASPANRPEFAIRWREVDAVAPAVTTGMSEAEAARAHRAERPLMVYVYPDPEDEDADDPRYAVEDDRAFYDDKVVVGARFFDCVRIHQEDAERDGTLADHARHAPCLVFVRPDYTTVKTLRGRFSDSRVFSAMCATLSLDYENCARTAYREQRKLERELVGVYEQRVELAKLEERIAEERSDRRRARLGEERDELEKEIRAAEDAVFSRERELYALKPKA